ncbi:NAD(P)/FAD-dependent oxidoreductase [Algihabitans albus]|uniref:NAD(P)/FAD-dependent oxidoreductase n=1 Tax=Algihabitans albus TaxID=2164067 RepID=UPI000E5D5CA4|nr:NAD(P)/FAD-dependent oxidoreductase [Algihabitans albus]
MLDTTPNLAVNKVLGDLDAALTEGDVEAAAALFEPQGYWRDLVAFTWNVRTLQGREEIAEMLRAQLADIVPRGWSMTPGEDAEDGGGFLQAWIDFETGTGRGHGHIRIRDGKIWTLLTTLKELKGYEERRGPSRPKGVAHGADRARKSWAEQRAEEDAKLGRETQPYVVIVGGGQGGIALGARLRQLNVPTIIIEKNERPGDSWRKRYKSLCLHDPVWYDHLPYIPFPENWPVFSPKDKIGDWLEMYTRVMELNYWGGTVAEQASWNEASKEWEVRVRRNGEDILLRPKQLVLATGMSGKPNLPAFPGQDVFKGEQQHSSQHPGPDAYKDKKVVVIGSNNSAHDICAALWEAGADVTMVQRSSTHIVRSEPLMEHGLGALYSEQALANGITTEKADLIFASIPYRLLPDFQKPIYDTIRELDADFYAGLEKVGFMLDWGDDGSGLFMKYLRRGSGYYIDVGASQLIIDGKIHLKAGSDVACLTEDSVVLQDGTELPADLVVYATGYGSMNGWAADLISQEVADRVGKCWGLGSGTTKDPGPWEGEERNMWKPTQQEGLWFHGGNLHQSRHYSQFLALQLKARQAALPIAVWGMGPVHHLS